MEIKKPTFRNLDIKERDTLYAYYDKHNANVLAMIRDRDCKFRSKNQIYYYRDLYNFHEQFIQNRDKKAKEMLESLRDSKVLAVRRAVELLEEKQLFIKGKDRNYILDVEGLPMIEQINPDHKEIETAWKIIKTELGEPTTIQKQETKHSGEIAQPIISGNEDDKEATEVYLKTLETNRQKRSLEKAKQDEEI